VPDESRIGWKKQNLQRSKVATKIYYRKLEIRRGKLQKAIDFEEFHGQKKYEKGTQRVGPEFFQPFANEATLRYSRIHSQGG
jgi:hypothetical protein